MFGFGMDWSCGPQLASERPVSSEGAIGKWTYAERDVCLSDEKEMPRSMEPLR